MKIKESGFLYRLQNRIFFIKDEVNYEDYEKLIKIDKNEKIFELSTNKYKTDETGNIYTSNSAWFILKKYKMEERLNKYKLHTGDVIKIGRIITRVKEIKFDSSKTNDKKNESKKSEDEKSSTSSVNKSKTSNKLILKDIGDFTNEKEVDNKHRHKIFNLANQRNATDPDLKDKIQVLNLAILILKRILILQIVISLIRTYRLINL